MFKQGSIYQKIRNQSLLVSVISLSIVCAVAFIGIAFMRYSVTDTSEKLGDAAAVDSMSALEEQMEASLLHLVENKASISDEKLMSVSTYVRMIASEAEKIIASPGDYKTVSVDFPNAANKGTIVAQLRLPEGVDYKDMSDEIGLIGNISNLLETIQVHTESAHSTYIGTEMGVSISADGDSDVKENVFDPRNREWYKTAKETGEMIWTDVFIDNSGRGLTITCAMPYYDEDGTLHGVAGLGMILDELQEVVIGTKIGETGHAFIVNENAEIIITDVIETDDEGKLLKADLLADDSILPLDTVNRILQGNSAIERVTIDGTECFVSYKQLKALPWSFVVVMDVDEVIAPAKAGEQRIIDMKDDALGSIDKVILVFVVVLFCAVALIILVNILQTKKLASRLAAPIVELSIGAGIIGAGNLDYQLSVKTGDEIEALGSSVNKMALDLKDYIHNLAIQTQEKERIASDLRIATDIQADMLPKIFPPFANRDDLHMASFILPAKEVGGDFYDFFFIDDEQKRIALVIADVSGKGVPAALFMVIAKVLIKNNKDLPCDEILNAVNNLLAADNNSSMFVTTFYSVLNLETGEYDYASAGHNPPVLYRKESGEFSFLEMPKTPPLAIFPGKKFDNRSVTLQKGDMLLLYTDGVTEAFNTQSVMYGSERLTEYLRRLIDKPVEEIVNELYASIKEFAAGEPQSDDITMLCCRYFGKQDAYGR